MCVRIAIISLRIQVKLIVVMINEMLNYKIEKLMQRNIKRDII
jgi:hypothetical protein